MLKVMLKGWFSKFSSRYSKDAVAVVVVVSMVAVMFGGSYLWTQIFLLTSVRTTGTVIDSWTTTSTSKGSTSRNTTYKYRFYVDGKEYTFKEAESFPAQKVGETYPVYYDPDDPSNATDGRRWGSLIAFCLCVIVIVIALRRGRHPPGADVISS
jgi:hypothetical protein